jgi:hypothetical protein
MSNPATYILDYYDMHQANDDYMSKPDEAARLYDLRETCTKEGLAKLYRAIKMWGQMYRKDLTERQFWVFNSVDQYIESFLFGK